NLQLCLTIKILVYEKVRFKLLCFSARADAFGREFRSVAAHGNKMDKHCNFRRCLYGYPDCGL
uniref:hypothetical protein n=1 Tax=Candidatus Scatocola faecipullorum TaxID=2840917 RepID=UPI004026CC2E